MRRLGLQFFRTCGPELFRQMNVLFFLFRLGHINRPRHLLKVSYICLFAFCFHLLSSSSGWKGGPTGSFPSFLYLFTSPFLFLVIILFHVYFPSFFILVSSLFLYCEYFQGPFFLPFPFSPFAQKKRGTHKHTTRAEKIITFVSCIFFNNKRKNKTYIHTQILYSIPF